MPRIFVRAAVATTALATAAALTAAPLRAQRAPADAARPAPFFQVAPYAGYMFFGDFL